ncbi:oligopeptide ABC transporter ATP-binding protein OppF [Allostella sp. ATCC 35155]|nr:oligopeptide ABC transporter ATP-binding protein OppF [Stella sp. ATCC 35155]
MESATVLEPTPIAASDTAPLISVEGLRVEFSTGRGVVKAVDGVDWSVQPGETMALVGESGCGKSVSALAVMRLLAKPAGRVAGGRILFEGRDLLTLSEEEMRERRGRDISMIFQEPMTSLNPILTIGLQIMEPLKIHLGMSEEQARARATELLGLVGIPDAERRLGQYPHQFSGGMRQRVMIAIGLACNPKLIIADEPTTALDVTIQAQILELMKELSRRLGITLVIITHNLGIVARYADRVAVMYAGRVVEEGPADRVFGAPRHPYTIGLMRSVPRLDRPRDAKLATIEGLPPNLLAPPSGCRFAARCPFRIDQCAIDPPYHDAGDGQRSACHRAEELAQGLAEATASPPAVTATSAATEILVDVRGLTKHFEVRGRGLMGAKGVVRAVQDVSFQIERGRTLGLVGESGCGKTTIGRTILRLEEATGGEVRFAGEDLVTASRSRMKELRTKIQVIFQDPYSSLNPRMTIGDIIAEPLVFRRGVARKEARERVAELLVQSGLYADFAERYPHQLSGGQRQRVGIARALAMDPSFIVCDEPVSALDVSIQGQIINLLDELQERLGLTYLFIAHDLAVVRHISHRIVVMYLGRVMEMADRDELYRAPLHPYTQALLDAAPVPDPALERARTPRALTGELPSPLSPPPGCVFHTRCPLATEECRRVVPEVREVRPGHFAACIKI